MWSQQDQAYMNQALFLAELGRGKTSPNPMVGAVVVSDHEQVVGTGYHSRAGGSHAEVIALNEAGKRAREGTLYCTLEPCSHQGRTGPCAMRVVKAGIRRVVLGMVDPNPLVSGNGIAYLRDHGLDVQVGLRQAAVERLTEAFRVWITRGRPFVTMKVAISQDGKVAARPGERTRLTSEHAQREVQRMRAEVDAIGIGSTTLLVDNPRLTVRGVQRVRPFTRVVFDRRLRMRITARLIDTLEDGPIIVITTPSGLTTQPVVADQLSELGVQIETIPNLGSGLDVALKLLGSLNITSFLLEGGPTIHRSAWDGGLVDRLQRFVAPVDLGQGGVAWLDVSDSALSDLSVKQLGPDVLTEGYVYRDS